MVWVSKTSFGADAGRNKMKQLRKRGVALDRSNTKRSKVTRPKRALDNENEVTTSKRQTRSSVARSRRDDGVCGVVSIDIMAPIWVA